MKKTSGGPGAKFRRLLRRRTVLCPGVFNPVTARLLENSGFSAGYISGAALHGQAALSDTGQLTRAEARRLHAWRAHVALTVTLARAHLLAGDWEAALREVRTATDALSSALGRLADADLARARSFVSDVYDIGVSAAIHAESEGDLVHFLEAGRAAALLRGLGGRAAALQATVPRALVERLAAATKAKLQAFAKLHENPDDGDGWVLLAKSYKHLGQMDEARSAYERAKAVGRSDAFLEENLYLAETAPEGAASLSEENE